MKTKTIKFSLLAVFILLLTTAGNFAVQANNESADLTDKVVTAENNAISSPIVDEGVLSSAVERSLLLNTTGSRACLTSTNDNSEFLKVAERSIGQEVAARIVTNDAFENTAENQKGHKKDRAELIKGTSTNFNGLTIAGIEGTTENDENSLGFISANQLRIGTSVVMKYLTAVVAIDGTASIFVLNQNVVISSTSDFISTSSAVTKRYDQGEYFNANRNLTLSEFEHTSNSATTFNVNITTRVNDVMFNENLTANLSLMNSIMVARNTVTKCEATKIPNAVVAIMNSYNGETLIDMVQNKILLTSNNVVNNSNDQGFTQHAKCTGLNVNFLI